MQNPTIDLFSQLNFRKALEAVTCKGRRVSRNPASSNAFLSFKKDKHDI